MPFSFIQLRHSSTVKVYIVTNLHIFLIMLLPLFSPDLSCWYHCWLSAHTCIISSHACISGSFDYFQNLLTCRVCKMSPLPIQSILPILHIWGQLIITLYFLCGNLTQFSYIYYIKSNVIQGVEVCQKVKVLYLASTNFLFSFFSFYHCISLFQKYTAIARPNSVSLDK